MSSTRTKEKLSKKLIEVFGKDTFSEKELTKDFYVELKIKCGDFLKTEDGSFDDDLMWSDEFKIWLMEPKCESSERFEQLGQRIHRFNVDRDWDQFHSPSNLAKSIAIEAGELLECFQWNDSEYNRDNVIQELADVANYCIQMSQVIGVDLIDIINKKMDITEKKYPVDKARGVSTKYNKL